MTGGELGILIGVLAALGLFIYGVRRAAERSQLGDAGQGIRRRLREVEDEAREQDEADDERAAAAAEARAAEDADEAGAADEEEGDDEAAAPAVAELQQSLARTRGGFVARLGKLFAKKQIDADLLGELEEVLLSADIGPKTAERLFGAVKGALGRDELGDADAIWAKLREESSRILTVDAPAIAWASQKPFVLLVLGVNGVGKTTTIGKLAAQLTGEGRKVLLAAGDTFRAAATEQLEIWGQRAGCPVVKGKSGGDPSSVIFDAIKQAQGDGTDVVIADTAGRLHTKVELMEELKKVRRVIDKALPGAPHETFLVLDSTTGQNAIQQAQLFKEAMAISGIVLTKLDGTAKGGVILGICDELAVPVRYIGIGEKVADLRAFDPAAFVAALYQADDAANAA